ncbi:spermidine/putrescine ABC transporter ATP-binding subunit [Rhizobium azooxidifex]|uniref:Spermidine/putrescine import ATP-binding protein PotA n=1 Tax=Mycoplana azooxidifex TaxID=1636188 RepID=A0A7W6DEG7_9HYPH|nr:ABC transporter ATP-binding protein [Mycoplana azooxidifex]MBB3979140.1 spermidine/putrescine ABC transporter ATP-binding subunit [Mycoplana azooxidifex]
MGNPAVTTNRGGGSVSLSGISRRYGASQVVSDVNLEARSGEILALLGPSGCGKTTTLRMIAGLVQPTSGEISIDGKPVTTLPVHRRNLGMLFQNYALFPHMTVLENVAFGLSMRGTPKAEMAHRVKQALALTHLTGFEDRMPAALSGGQQQRVALARAIVYQPKVLLLDEPFGALDKKLREAMQIELRQLCNKLGLTTILVTHDQEEALVLADQIAVMRGGRIEQVASAREVYERPASHFVADFIGTSNFIPSAVLESRNGMTTLAGLSGNVFTSSMTTNLGAGEKAIVAVRPESIRLTPGEPSGGETNTISGNVLRTVFKGQSLSVWLDVPGLEFVCALPIEAIGATPPEPGTRWTANWSAERTLIVREQ